MVIPCIVKFFVVSTTMGVIQPYRGGELGGVALIPVELKMILLVIIDLVVKIALQGPLITVHFSSKIIGAVTCQGHRIDPKPRLIGDFMSAKGERFNKGVVITIGGLQEI